MAEQVGVEYGRAMAAGLGSPDVAAEPAVAALGAARRRRRAHRARVRRPHRERNNQLRIVNNHCPFGDVAIEHPVICAVDRGMVKGMLTALYGDTEPSTEASLPQGDTFCATSV